MPWAELDGRRVWVDPDTGLAQLRTRGGTIMEVDPASAARLIEQGEYAAASPEQAEDYDRRQEARKQPLKTAGEAAVAGAIDVATIPVQGAALQAEALSGLYGAGARAIGAEGAADLLETVGKEAADVRQNVSGRAVMRNVAGLVEEARGGEAGAGERAYQEASLIRTEENPGAAMAGYVAGQLPFAIATPAARGAGLIAQGAAEGLVLGTASAGENAFLRGDDAASAEDALVDGMFGAIIGGVTGGVMAGGERGLGAIFGRGAREVAESGADRGAYRTLANVTPDDAAGILSRATGEDISPGVAADIWNTHVAPGLGKGSQLVSGADADFVAKGMSATAEGRLIRKIAENPQAVIEEFRATLPQSVTSYRGAFDDVTELSRDMGIKETKVRELLPEELPGAPVLRRFADADAADAAMNLTREQRRAIDDFTGGTFRGVRDAQRGGKPGAGSVWEGMYRQGEIIEEAIASNPNYEGVLYRGLDISPEEALSLATRGEISFDGMTSSASRNRQWTLDQFTGGAGEGALLKIENGRGLPVHRFAGGTTKEELEVLMSGKSRFAVTGFEVLDNGVTEIRLRQLDDVSARSGPMQAVQSRARQALSELNALSARFPVDELESAEKRLLAKTLKQARYHLDQATSAQDTAAGYVNLDSSKRQLQKHILRLRKDAAKLADKGESASAAFKRELSDILQETQESTRRTLEDSSVFGDAGRMQQRINAAWGEKLEGVSGFRGMWRKVRDDYVTGRGIFEVSEEGVESFLRKVGRKAGGQEYADMVRQLDADEALVDAIAESVGETEASRAFRDAAKGIRATLEDVKTRGGYANQFAAVKEASGGAVNLGKAGLGYAVGGMPGAGLVSLLANPADMMRIAGGIEATARRVDERLNGALGRWFRRAGGEVPKLPQMPDGLGGFVDNVKAKGKATGRAAKRAAVPAAIRVFQGKSTDRRDAYERHVKELQELTSNPALRQKRLETTLASVRNPTMAASLAMAQMRGLAFLKTKLPTGNPSSLTPHLDRIPPSESELDSFARYWSTVRDPMSAVEDLERGRCTYEQIEALKAVWPKFYQRLRTKALQYFAAAKTRPPYELSKQMDLLLDLNGAAESSVAPDFLQRQQERLLQLQQRQPPQGRPQGTAPKLSDRYESDLSLDELERA